MPAREDKTKRKSSTHRASNNNSTPTMRTDRPSPASTEIHLQTNGARRRQPRKDRHRHPLEAKCNPPPAPKIAAPKTDADSTLPHFRRPSTTQSSSIVVISA
jgi:hypothetical protein